MEFIYITNDPDRARLVEGAGVDKVMVDLEINGKEGRQGHLNTVISHHRLGDISRVRSALNRAALVVRINPIFDGSQAEVEECVARGADWLMLPMFRRPEEVACFVDMVGARARTCLLLETGAALARLPSILEVPGIDQVHIGLNDLHISLGLDFMFEILSEGLAEYAARLIRDSGIPFGIGGIARLGSGRLPAELVLAEQLRLGSSQTILSRDFAEIFDTATTPDDSARMFAEEVDKLRSHCRISPSRTQNPELRRITRQIAFEAFQSKT